MLAASSPSPLCHFGVGLTSYNSIEVFLATVVDDRRYCFADYMCTCGKESLDVVGAWKGQHPERFAERSARQLVTVLSSSAPYQGC